MPLLPVDGAELCYEDTDDGVATILFSHGLHWSLRMFDAQVAHLPGRYRCVAYDHRGQGQSRDDGSPYDMERLTEDAAQVIEKLGLAPCVFVGLSMGGFVGLRLAARRPELLRGLVLVESAADREPRANVPKYRAMELITRRIGFRPLLPPIMKIMFSRSFLRDPARAVERRAIEQSILALDPARTGRALEAVVTRSGVEHLLPLIRVPTLVLHDAIGPSPDRAGGLRAVCRGSPRHPARSRRCARRPAPQRSSRRPGGSPWDSRATSVLAPPRRAWRGPPLRRAPQGERQVIAHAT